MVSIDATFLTGLTQGMLFTASRFDANKKLALFSFAIAQTEDGTSWSWFLQYCTDIFPNIRVLVSDGAKGLESSVVKELLEDFVIPYTRCTWNILERNLPKSGIRYNNIEKRALFAAARSRTMAHANTVLQNSDAGIELCIWWNEREPLCA